MIAGIASLVFIPLLAVSMVHFMWAVGSTWPVKDQKTLARTVAGFRNVEQMPPKPASAAVAIAALAAGIWALSMTGEDDGVLLTWGGALLSVVFLGRGAIGFTAWWRAKTPEEPFATFDRKLYSPMCLLIGTGFLYLTWWRLT